MIPAREVGGDLYDIVERNGRIVITIGDVCGKGVPASLFMAVTQTVMRLTVRSGVDLKAEIETANTLLVADNREEMFTTLFCAVLDEAASTLTYCNCGHNPPLLLRRGESAFERLAACGPPLGMMDGIKYAARAITLGAGDLVLLYTDGVTEAEDASAAQFGMARLEESILMARSRPARELVEHVIEGVRAFAAGAPQSDDITCAAIVRASS
jgi:sigma-B regulation protein RsbU (phosphoserine phosphatase)